MKRILSALIAMVLTVTVICVPVPVSAWWTYGDFKYSINNDGVSVTITGYTGNGGDIVIPESVDGYKVTMIASGAFKGCASLTSVTIPSSVTEIRDSVFYNCTGLTSVTIPDSVTHIGYNAFYRCTGLTSITIPDSVVKIGDFAFVGCTGLTTITIPDSVVEIGSNVFSTCTGLTSVTISNSLTTISSNAFVYCRSLNNITIPDSVIKIDFNAFYGCTGLTSITIPESVAVVRSSAFNGCVNLAEITLPKMLREFYCDIFSGCENIKTITYNGSQDCWESFYFEFEDCNPEYRFKSTGHETDKTDMDIVVPPTCTEQGYTKHSCSICFSVYYDSYISPTGHTVHKSMSTEATCLEQGLEYFECDNCEFSIACNTYPLGHNFISHAAQAPTAISVGWNAYEACSRCDYTTYVELPMLESRPGDTDSNGTVNVLDAITVAKYISGWFNGMDPLPINLAAADVNGDGTVNVLDAIYIVKHVAGHEDCPL